MKRFALFGALILGLVLLIEFCARTPAGRNVLLAAGALVVLFTVAVLGGALGRGLAAVRNALALHHGRAELEEIWRARRSRE